MLPEAVPNTCDVCVCAIVGERFLSINYVATIYLALFRAKASNVGALRRYIRTSVRLTAKSPLDLSVVQQNPRIVINPCSLVQRRVTVVVESLHLSVCLFSLNLRNDKFYGDKMLYMNVQC